MHLETDEQRVLAAVESVLSPLLAEGRARLDVSPAAGSQGALIEVTPTRESACPVTIHCDAPGELDLYVGRYKLTTHIWKTREWERGDFAALETELSDWLSALIAGRYEEEVRLTHDGQAGKGRGVLELSTGPWRFTYSNAPTIGKRGPWQKVPYTAY
jgi:hypothetical protein